MTIATPILFPRSYNLRMQTGLTTSHGVAAFLEKQEGIESWHSGGPFIVCFANNLNTTDQHSATKTSRYLDTHKPDQSWRPRTLRRTIDLAVF